VSVTINGVNAPVYVVTATQISALVPYTLDPTATFIFIANIQVTSNNQTSNTVTEYLGLTSPGVFTTNQNGLGNGAILHADFTAVTETSPAKPGETVLVYLTGLGAVSPAVTTGAAAPNQPAEHHHEPNLCVGGRHQSLRAPRYPRKRRIEPPARAPQGRRTAQRRAGSGRSTTRSMARSDAEQAVSL
jgi:uncharacterized protein (TIGR03437 family)